MVAELCLPQGGLAQRHRICLGINGPKRSEVLMSVWLCTKGSRKVSSELGNLGLVITVYAKGCRSVEIQTEN